MIDVFLALAYAASFAPVYAVTETRFDGLVERVGKLAKRAQKLGLAAPYLEAVDRFFVPQLRRVNVEQSVTIGRADPRIVKWVSDEVAVITTDERVPMVRFRLVGQAPKLAGWSFVATLEHLGEGATLLCAVPGHEVPSRFRQAEPHCEHCQTVRRRAQTFVLVHEDGRDKQVGRQCLKDFLGHQDPNKAAAYAEELGTLGELFDAAVAGSDEDSWGGGGGGAPRAWDLAEYVAYCAASIRVHGWVSRGEARERCVVSTADSALDSMLPPPMYPREAILRPELRDRELAAAALAWVETDLMPKDEAGASSDYEHNLVTSVRLGVCLGKTMGVVASLVSAYNRHLGREIERKRALDGKHVGEVGKRQLFEGLALSRVVDLEGVYGTTHLHVFLDADGNTLIWKASAESLEVGATFDVTATVKSHGENRKTGAPETYISRAKAVLVRKAAA